jgi:hypothetical protein
MLPTHTLYLHKSIVIVFCSYWDGVTDYTVEEAEEVEEQRIEQFGDWIEEQELPDELQLQVEE